MQRNSRSKLAFILNQVRSAGTMYGSIPSKPAVSMSRPATPNPGHAIQSQQRGQSASYRGHFDQDEAIQLSLPDTVSHGFSMEEDVELEFGQPEIIQRGNGYSGASSFGFNAYEDVYEGSGSDALNPVQRQGDTRQQNNNQFNQRFGNNHQGSNQRGGNDVTQRFGNNNRGSMQRGGYDANQGDESHEDGSQQRGGYDSNQQDENYDNRFSQRGGSDSIQRVGNNHNNGLNQRGGSDSIQQVRNNNNGSMQRGGNTYHDNGNSRRGNQTDFDEDMEDILGGSQGGRFGNQFSMAEAPKERKMEQPSAHTLFDKMAKGMEYATTYDVGSVNLSKVFDQFDTAMEVEEMTKVPLKRKDDAVAMAEMFSQFDREMKVEPPVEQNEPRTIPVSPTWRPKNPKITGYDEMVEKFAGSLALLERSKSFMDNVLIPFDSGANAWIGLHFKPYASTESELAAGFCSIQVRKDGAWVNLSKEGLSLEGVELDWANDVRIVVGMNHLAQEGKDSPGGRISTIVHELALHGLNNAALLNRYSQQKLAAEAMRIEYCKAVLLELDHHSIAGTLQPLNQLYTTINAQVLATLRANPNWIEYGEVNHKLIQDHPDLIAQAPSDFKHLQKKNMVAVWYQFLTTVALEQRRSYNPDQFFNLLGAEFKGVTAAELNRLMREGTEQEVRAWHAARKAKPENQGQPLNATRRQ